MKNTIPLPVLQITGARQEQPILSAPSIQRAVRRVTAPFASVLIVSRGDEKLLELPERRGGHFPQTKDGTYAGHHPADSQEAIARLEALRMRGWEYLVFPESALWWLDYYGDFRAHLEDRYQRVGPDDGYVIYSLSSQQDLESSLERYSREWYEAFYREMGDGIPCYRATALYDGTPEDGMLQGCTCCRINTRLHLLPGEEAMFEDVLNDSDFVLDENPVLPGRRVIVCSKLGACGGRKPYVCRTAPVHFIQGLVLIEESLCRLLASTFLVKHRKWVERLRRTVYRFGLDREVLGYGRRIENGYIDYER